MRLKKLFFYTLGSLTAILLALILLLYLNRNKIASLVEQKINSNIIAHFDFADASISLRHFPYVGIRLDDMSITGSGKFEGDTLFQSASFDLAVNPFSLLKLKEGIKLRSVHLERPDIRVLILPDGSANYMIMKESGSDNQTESEELVVRLHSYSINDGNFIYDDRARRNLATIANLDQKGFGDFSSRQFIVTANTEIGNCSFWRNSIPMIKDVAVQLDNKLHVDLDQNKYELDETRLVLNDLILTLIGTALWNEEKASYNITFETPQNDFKELISLIPSLYSENYALLDAAGLFSLSGNIASSDTSDFPELKVDLLVSDGYMRYPEKDVRFQNINLEGHVSNPGSGADGTEIDIPRISWILNDRPFDGSFALKTPYSDPDLQAILKGSVDLADIHRTFIEASSQRLAGILEMDLNSKAKWSDIERQVYERVSMSGELTVQNLVYEQADYPAFTLTTGGIHLGPQSWSLRKWDGSFGRSDFRLEGKLDNILAVLSDSKPINGSFRLESNVLDFNEWIPGEEDSSPMSPDTLYKAPDLYSRLGIDAHVQVGIVQYSDYEFRQVSTNGTLNGQDLQFEGASCLFGESSLTGNGLIQSLWDYIYRGLPLKGNLNIHSNKLDLGQFMDGNVPGQSGSQDTGPTEPSVIPINYDFQIQYTSDEVSYQNAVCDRVNGIIKIQGGEAFLDDVRFNLFGGQFILKGKYSTIIPEEPVFSLDYEVQNLDFQQTFKTFNTYSKLAPVGEFINGKFNSNLKIGAKLKPDLTPVITSIQGEGFIETFNAIIDNFPPLVTASNLLQLDFLKNWNIKNTRNWFEISEGAVTVRPFDVSYQDVTMTISGKHTLENEMDYRFMIQLPYNRIAAKVKPGQSLGHLASQASRLGIRLNENVEVTLLVRLQGTIKQPKVEVELVNNIKELVTSQVKEKVDSIRNELTETLIEKKAEIVGDLQAEVTAIRDRANDRVEQIMAEARRISEGIRQEGYNRADQLEKAAGNDPLRKFAAQKAAEKIRIETDKKVDKIIADAELQAKSVLERSESRVDSLLTADGQR